jgi:predicted nucleic acid-binding Zn ribbon protein
MELVAGSSTPAPGPNALPFGTPVATGAAQVLCFGASPLVRATALPAPAAAGAEKKRKVLREQTNTPAKFSGVGIHKS